VAEVWRTRPPGDCPYTSKPVSCSPAHAPHALCGPLRLKRCTIVSQGPRRWRRPRSGTPCGRWFLTGQRHRRRGVPPPPRATALAVSRFVYREKNKLRLRLLALNRPQRTRGPAGVAASPLAAGLLVAGFLDNAVSPKRFRELSRVPAFVTNGFLRGCPGRTRRRLFAGELSLRPYDDVPRLDLPDTWRARRHRPGRVHPACNAIFARMCEDDERRLALKARVGRAVDRTPEEMARPH